MRPACAILKDMFNNLIGSLLVGPFLLLPLTSPVLVPIVLIYFIALSVGLVQMRKSIPFFPSRFFFYMGIEIVSIIAIVFLESVFYGNVPSHSPFSQFLPATLLLLNTLALIFVTIKEGKGRKLFVFTMGLPFLYWLFSAALVAIPVSMFM